MSDHRIECLENAIRAIYRAAFEGDVFPSTVAGIVEAHAGQFGYGLHLEDRRACGECHGHGVLERCCGHSVGGSYWEPPECCGQMLEEDCPECKATGRAPKVEEPVDDLPF